MIAKHIPISSVNKSSFAGLVNYILDAKNKTERIGIVRPVNCFSDRVDCVVAEVLNTQQMNKRATSDKTYHLVISFRDDELSEDILKKVEDKLCDGLGFGEHQRISVVHHDTDHLHIHIAINKIHPTRLTIHNPHYDYKVIGELCEQLELEHGLTPDNHETLRRGAQGRESNIEFKAGSESLIGWMKQECLEPINSAGSWNELQQLLKDHGLELKERGNGFVFVSSNGVGVKASSVDRSLSKANLVKKFGAYENLNNGSDSDAKITHKNNLKQYEKKPLRGKRDTTRLYAQYKKEQNDAAIQGKNQWIKLRSKKDRAIESVKQKAKLKRLLIKSVTAGRLQKKIMYATVHQVFKMNIDSIKKDYAQAYQASKTTHRRMDWLSWLVNESKQGNSEALEILRSRKDYTSTDNSVSGAPKDNEFDNKKPFIETITKTGTVIYNIGSSAIRDSGQHLFVLAGSAKEKILDVLTAAMKKFGRTLTINGADAFREKVVQVVVEADLDVQFDDEVLEQRRLDALNNRNGLGLSGGGKKDSVNRNALLKQNKRNKNIQSTRKGRSR